MAQKKWAAGAAVVLLGASWTMIQIDEYALAGIVLIAAMVAFSIQLYDWKGVVDHRNATYLVKGLSASLIAVSFLFFGAVIAKKKGDKPWSNLLPKQKREQMVSTGTPSQTPLLPPKVELKGEINRGRLSNTDWKEFSKGLSGRAMITFIITIVNTGDVNTTARNWKSWAVIPNKGLVPGTIIQFNKLTLVDKGEKPTVYTGEETIVNKTLNPIVPGKPVVGVIAVEFTLLTVGELLQAGNQLFVGFIDHKDHPYVITCELCQGKDFSNLYQPGLEVR